MIISEYKTDEDAALQMELKQYIYKTITIVILYKHTYIHVFKSIQIKEEQQAADTFFIEKQKQSPNSLGLFFLNTKY